MMQRRLLTYAFLWVSLTAAASAQQRPIYDPDDFVDPRTRIGSLFVSRLAAGGVSGLIDDYRAAHQNAGFLHLANSFYWSGFQFDYKHSEVRGTGPDGPVLTCNCTPRQFFPTPPSRRSTPEAPPPGPKETLQFAWYYPRSAGAAGPPVMQRYRVTWSRQRVDTDVALFSTDRIIERRHGREQSFGLDADIYFPVAGREVFGSLTFARTARTHTTNDRAQSEFTYTSRFPAAAVHDVLLRATLTVGGVSGRGESGLNVVNPAFEAFWHSMSTQANVHLIWSPQATRSGTNGWERHSQIALFVDRALSVKSFRPSP